MLTVDRLDAVITFSPVINYSRSNTHRTLKMSLKLKKLDSRLEILEGDLPDADEFRVFTEDEVLQFEGWKQWMSLTDEQREDMTLQTQSAAYKEWMEEESPSEVGEPVGAYGKHTHRNPNFNDMNIQLKAHIEAGILVLDEPLPEGFANSEVIVSIERLTDGRTHPRPEELAQSQTGFARSVLLDPEEDVWDHE